MCSSDLVSARLVLAARNMAAKRRRAAALDRRHDLHLAEADVAGVGFTPRRPVVAEDIRDLQRWTGHSRRRLGRRLHFLAVPLSFPGSFVVWSRQPVERPLDGGDHAGGDVEIACGGFQFLVTQEQLDLSEIGILLEQVGGEAVALMPSSA